MRFSQLFCPTLKEVPREAEVTSHQLMLRAGLIRKTASGLYSYLPLGLRVIQKMEAIVREEMNKAGAQELLMPMVTPAELWQRSGRWDKYGKELCRLKDRHNNEFCLGPTHEEVITSIVNYGVKSYKQLPINMYQIQTKFRDEIRPRFGLMRSREFSMKDSYSFHDSDESLNETYQLMEKTYDTIFNRCGLKFARVEADNGAMGGVGSAEYVVIADTGEDTIYECNNCHAAANIELSENQNGAQKKCPKCNSEALTYKKGIEVGHIFKLGDTYGKSMSATFVNREGREQPFIMGCYGIGIGRTVASAIEQSHDEKGIKWPLALAPFTINVIATLAKDEVILKQAESVYRQLNERGIDTILDDRKESPGIKFKDAELIGFPLHIVIGKKWKEAKQYELNNRLTGESRLVNEEELFKRIFSIIEA